MNAAFPLCPEMWLGPMNIRGVENPPRLPTWNTCPSPGEQGPSNRISAACQTT